MVHVDGKDFAIARVGGKPVLFKVVSVEDGIANARPVSDDMRTEGSMVIPLTDFVANLGRNPHVGSAYGIYVEPPRRRVDDEFWGTFVFFRRMDDDERKDFMRSMKKIGQQIERNNLPAPTMLQVNVRSPKGKYAGEFKYIGSEDKPDIMTLRPADLNAGLSYVVSHEYAHLLWYNHLSPQSRLRWIKLYHKYVRLEKIKPDVLESILNDVVEAGGVRAYARAVEQDVKPIIARCVRYMSDVHGLKAAHVDLMISVDNDVEQIRPYWPTALQFSERELFVTDYARKSPEELFAECFALDFTGTHLPKDAAKLLAATLSKLSAE